jgi:hypothetical protein
MSMLPWLIIVAFVAVLTVGGCALAIGRGTVASVNTRADAEVKREVAEDSATIEDVLNQQPKEKRKWQQE